MNIQKMKQSTLKSEMENNLNRDGKTVVNAYNTEVENSLVLKSTDSELMYVVISKLHGGTSYILARYHWKGFNIHDEVIMMNEATYEAFITFISGNVTQ